MTDPSRDRRRGIAAPTEAKGRRGEVWEDYEGLALDVDDSDFFELDAPSDFFESDCFESDFSDLVLSDFFESDDDSDVAALPLERFPPPRLSFL
jgi:hypothetical protein